MDEIEISKYLVNSKHNDDQINIFQIQDLNLFIVADGVSQCTNGRIASSFLCYYIEEFFNKNYSGEFLNRSNLGENKISYSFCREAIDYSGRKLKEFEQGINRLLAYSLSDNLFLNDFLLAQVQTHGRQILEKYIKHHLDMIMKKTDEDSAQISEEIAEKIIAGIDRNTQQLSFKSTLCLAALKRVKDSELYELTTAILGDPEVLILKSEENGELGDYFNHYARGCAGVLTSFFNGDGINGNMDFASRIIKPHDIFVMATDGGKLGLCERGGVPYSPLLSTITQNNSNFQEIAKKWYEWLSKEDAIDDDYSVILVRLN